MRRFGHPATIEAALLNGDAEFLSGHRIAGEEHCAAEFSCIPRSVSAPEFTRLRRVRLCCRDTLLMIGNRTGTAGVNRTIGSGERAMPDDILPFDKTTEPGLSRRSFGFAL